LITKDIADNLTIFCFNELVEVQNIGTP